jgi:dienelactone hydrolase
MYEFFPGNYRWSYNTLLAFASGGQLGDVDLVLNRLKGKLGDEEAWIREWRWLGERLEARAAVNLREGGRQSASDNLYLACLYHTIGEHFIPPNDPRRMASYRHVLATFDQARGLARWPIERVEVPYEGSVLPSYFMPSITGEGRRPAVIFLCGLDTTKELSYLRIRDQLALRGMHCLAVDTPGIGEALKVHHLPTRPDYEVPVGAAIDYLQSRADVDPNRIGIIGSSLGGYYVARAAAFEPRLRAAVAWGVIYDYQEVWRRRLTIGGAIGAPKFQLMFVTGTDNMDDAVARIADFKVAPIGARVKCPFLIAHGAEDQQVPAGDAEKMFAAIGASDKELKIFDGENGGAAHCQFDNQPPALQYIADWLVRKL